MTAMVDTYTAKDAVLELLRAIPTLNVFDGNVNEADPDLAAPFLDADGGVHIYAVLWASAGNPTGYRLCATPDTKAWPFQVTAAGGDQTRALRAADLVYAALVSRRLSLPDGRASTPIRTVLGDQGPARLDRTVKPTRHWVPLLFSCRLA